MTTDYDLTLQPECSESPARIHYRQALMQRAYSDALLPLRTAIAQNDAQAMGLLGTLYMLGHGVARDAQEACLWFRQGAVRGDIASQIALGLCLAGGQGTVINRSEAAFWLFRAARAGATVAMEMLGWLIRHHPELIGEHFNHAEVQALIAPVPARATREHASGWAVRTSARHPRGQ